MRASAPRGRPGPSVCRRPSRGTHAAGGPRRGGLDFESFIKSCRGGGGGERNLRSLGCARCPGRQFLSGHVVAHAHASTVQARQAGMEVEISRTTFLRFVIDRLVDELIQGVILKSFKVGLSTRQFPVSVYLSVGPPV